MDGDGAHAACEAFSDDDGLLSEPPNGEAAVGLLSFPNGSAPENGSKLWSFSPPAKGSMSMLVDANGSAPPLGALVEANGSSFKGEPEAANGSLPAVLDEVNGSFEADEGANGSFVALKGSDIVVASSVMVVFAKRSVFPAFDLKGSFAPPLEPKGSSFVLLEPNGSLLSLAELNGSATAAVSPLSAAAVEAKGSLLVVAKNGSLLLGANGSAPPSAGFISAKGSAAANGSAAAPTPCCWVENTEANLSPPASAAVKYLRTCCLIWLQCVENICECEV